MLRLKDLELGKTYFMIETPSHQWDDFNFEEVKIVGKGKALDFNYAFEILDTTPYDEVTILKMGDYFSVCNHDEADSNYYFFESIKDVEKHFEEICQDYKNQGLTKIQKETNKLIKALDDELSDIKNKIIKKFKEC